jgi:hypothetical protein
MHIEILTFEGCPNAGRTRDAVEQAVRLEGADAIVDDREVDTPALAEHLRFLGSPSVRIDGQDVEPSALERTGYGLMCRVYDHGAVVTGAPSVAMIRAAIRRHAAAVRTGQ